MIQKRKAHYTKAMFYARLLYFFFPPYQITPLHILRPLVFGLTPFGWFISI
jgi:hypothetical protein